ncbi:GNAT family N-acetyltransferase [Nocardia sp. BMG111209]|uniref:GNAT family N-acetyltransferase n=1 Tax=Nocardia sp. BMG111209 TaxID=1160137 RepID=UPI0003A9A404|nr:GNAT family N-acetyltransferase [Nocardia sp. BMG111209]
MRRCRQRRRSAPPSPPTTTPSSRWPTSGGAARSSRYSPRLFLDHFAATSLIAESGPDLAGFLVGFHSPTDTEAAYIHFVGVHPDRRGAGTARTLYHRFFAAAVADGRRVVRAITSPGNQGSVAFHTTLGFTVRDSVPDYHGPGRPMTTFERQLRP